VVVVRRNHSFLASAITYGAQGDNTDALNLSARAVVFAIAAAS